MSRRVKSQAKHSPIAPSQVRESEKRRAALYCVSGSSLSHASRLVLNLLSVSLSLSCSLLLRLLLVVLFPDDDDLADFLDDDMGGDMLLDKDDDFGVKKDTLLLASIGVQDPFQPASTPATAVGSGEARFLAYNLVGNITSLEEQSGSDDKIHIVQLNYTDTTKHKASKFRDFFGFKIAAMGAHGAVFARSAAPASEQSKQIDARLCILLSRPSLTRFLLFVDLCFLSSLPQSSRLGQEGQEGVALNSVLPSFGQLGQQGD